MSKRIGSLQERISLYEKYNRPSSERTTAVSSPTKSVISTTSIISRIDPVDFELSMEMPSMLAQRLDTIREDLNIDDHIKLSNWATEAWLECRQKAQQKLKKARKHFRKSLKARDRCNENAVPYADIIQKREINRLRKELRSVRSQACLNKGKSSKQRQSRLFEQAVSRIQDMRDEMTALKVKLEAAEAKPTADQSENAFQAGVVWLSAKMETVVEKLRKELQNLTLDYATQIDRMSLSAGKMSKLKMVTEWLMECIDNEVSALSTEFNSRTMQCVPDLQEFVKQHPTRTPPRMDVVLQQSFSKDNLPTRLNLPEC